MNNPFPLKYFNLNQTTFSILLFSFIFHLVLLSLCSFRFYKKADLQKPSLIFLGSILRQSDFDEAQDLSQVSFYQTGFFEDLSQASSKSQTVFIPTTQKPLTQAKDEKQFLKPLAYTRKASVPPDRPLDKEFQFQPHQPLKLSTP